MFWMAFRRILTADTALLAGKVKMAYFAIDWSIWDRGGTKVVRSRVF
jgi:hypothetical protein